MLNNNLISNIKTKILNLTTKTSEKPKIVLGLSGGADSTFLFYILKELHHEDKINLIAAHLNHGWRDEAIIDETFCKNLCLTNKIEVIIANANEFTIKIKQNGSKEEYGRKLRRYFLNEVLKNNSADYIALAHHQQDQQETFFWRIIRGSTLNGLTCMKESEGNLIRPLLNLSKNEILTFLKKNNLKFIEDESNFSEAFLRNRIRKHVIPAMNKCDSRFEKKLNDTIKMLQEEEAFLDHLTLEQFEKTFKKENNKLIGNLNYFKALNPVLQKRLIIKWLCSENVKFQISNNYLNEILNFLYSKEGGTHQINQSWNIVKKQKQFWINF